MSKQMIEAWKDIQIDAIMKDRAEQRRHCRAVVDVLVEPVMEKVQTLPPATRPHALAMLESEIAHAKGVCMSNRTKGEVKP